MHPNAQRYLHVGSARDLSGADRVLYRLLEIFPAFLAILTLGGFITLSFLHPTIAAYVTIGFSIYWLFKTSYLSIHLHHNFKRLRHHLALDWKGRLENLKTDHVLHLVIFPFYREGYQVLRESIDGILRSSWNPKRVALVLAAEERAGEEARAIAERLRKEFSPRFFDVIVTAHPQSTPGELAGKGSNAAYAAEEARTRLLDARNIPYEDVVVSAFDADTVIYPEYFACLTWHFLTAENPHRVSFQPVPLFNNNIWEAPTLSRVLAYSSTFWQMIQQERPEKLATFSSHAMSFKALREVGYWQKNIVSEDSRIYWNFFAFYDGAYEVVPMSYPISMDANVAPTFFGTVRNLYKQHRRWTWGVENVPYLLFHCLKNPRIPLWKKLGASFTQIEGFWSLSTNPLILFLIGWMPLIVGGREFSTTVLSYNLPIVAKTFLTLAMLGLIASAVFTLYLVPKRPAAYTSKRTILMALQWILVPITMVLFSSIPGLESQLRLALGSRLGFWPTPKERPSAS